MAVLPNHLKTWQMSGALGSTLCIPVGSGTDWLVKYIEYLTRYSLFPWEVLGSSDAVTAGMDGVNRITSFAALVGVGVGSTAPRSWVVMRNPATGVSWCFHFRPAVGGLDDCEMGFSTTSAFTGGSITARPTAPDAVFVDLDVFTGAPGPNRMCIWHSADGLHTMAVCQGTALGADDVQATLFQGFIHNVPRGVLTWERPYWMGFYNRSGWGLDPHAACGSGAAFTTLSERPGAPGQAFSRSPYLCTEGVHYGVGVEPCTQFGWSSSGDGKLEVSACNFYLNSNGIRGFCGQWPDLLCLGRNALAAVPDGNGNFPDAEKKWVQYGAMMYPWDGVSAWAFP